MKSLHVRVSMVYSTVYSGADQRKHQSSASLAFVWGIHRWPVNSPHKRPVTRKKFPFDDVIMNCRPGRHDISAINCIAAVVSILKWSRWYVYSIQLDSNKRACMFKITGLFLIPHEVIVIWFTGSWKIPTQMKYYESVFLPNSSMKNNNNSG